MQIAIATRVLSRLEQKSSYSFPRPVDAMWDLVMGKVEIGMYCCLTTDILTNSYGERASY